MYEPGGQPFIGRHVEREDIKMKLLAGGCNLLLFGQPMVGKAKLALQVAEELGDQLRNQNDSLVVYTLDCKDIADWAGVLRALYLAISLEEPAVNENLLEEAILQQLAKSSGGKFLLLMLRVHRLQPTGFDVQRMTRCLQAFAARGVMALMTSRRQLLLPHVQRVNPLTSNDALRLFHHHAPTVNPEEFESLLQRYSYGLPPLVLQMAQLVSQGPLLSYTVTELREALEEDEGLLMENLSQEARDLFSILSPEVQGHVSSLAQLLDNGSFSLEALEAAVGVEGARLRAILRRLNDESSLIIDNQPQRMRIEPLVLHHVRKLGHVTTDDQARLRVVTLLGRTLMRAKQDLYDADQDTVYGHLQGDWPQLQRVLRQAIHCTDNTYRAYLQVALKADRLLAKSFPNEALMFYKNMATAAVLYGSSRDHALFQSLVGMTLSQSTGPGLQEAQNYFDNALQVLQQEQHSVIYLRLLCDMGISKFRLNRLEESETCLRKAVEISSDISDAEDDREILFHLLHARAFLALPCLFRGHFAESKELLLETLGYTDQYVPHHPAKPVLINSLGLVYERSGEDQDKALHFYTQALVERRRYAEVALGDLVPSLNNVGMQYSRRGDLARAVEFLQEAAAIRTHDNRWNYYTALTEQHLGQVFIQMGDYKRAERHLQEAACIYIRCTPDHDSRKKVALCLAHLYVTQPLRDLAQAKDYLLEVSRLAEGKEKNLTDNGLEMLLTAIEHTVQLRGWTAMTTLLENAQRLLNSYDGDPSKKLQEHKAIITDIVAMAASDMTEDRREELRNRIINQCQMCKYLSDSGDARLLWRQMEAEGAEFQRTCSKLRESEAIQKVLALFQQHGSRGSAQREPGNRCGEIPLPLSGETSLNKGQRGELQQIQHLQNLPSKLKKPIQVTVTVGLNQNESREIMTSKEEERPSPMCALNSLPGDFSLQRPLNELNSTTSTRRLSFFHGQRAEIKKDPVSSSSSCTFTCSETPSFSLSDDSAGNVSEGQPAHRMTAFHLENITLQAPTPETIGQILLKTRMNTILAERNTFENIPVALAELAPTKMSGYTRSGIPHVGRLAADQLKAMEKLSHSSVRDQQSERRTTEGNSRDFYAFDDQRNKLFLYQSLQTRKSVLNHAEQEQLAALRKLNEQMHATQDQTSPEELCQLQRQRLSHGHQFIQDQMEKAQQIAGCLIGGAGSPCVEKGPTDQDEGYEQNRSSHVLLKKSLQAQEPVSRPSVTSSLDPPWHYAPASRQAVEQEESLESRGNSRASGWRGEVSGSHSPQYVAAENDERQNCVCYSEECCCSHRPAS